MLSCKALKLNLDIKDPMSFKGGLKFSWDNMQSGGENNGEVKLNLHVSNGLTHGKTCKVLQYAIKGDEACITTTLFPMC